MTTPVGVDHRLERRPERVVRAGVAAAGFDAGATTAASVDSAGVAAGDRRAQPRLPPRAARRRSASAPNRASSARIARPLPQLRRSTESTRKSGIATRNGMLFRCIRAICNTMSSMPADPPKSSSARALLAVCRAAGAADRRGARVARSRSARGAVRRAAASVLDHARVSGARRAATSRARSSSRAASAEFRETGQRRAHALPRAVLVRAMPRKLRDLFRDRRRVGRDRSPDRRSAGAVRARAVAAARLVPHSAVTPVPPSSRSTGSARGSRPS